jgi:hypothetical protein
MLKKWFYKRLVKRKIGRRLSQLALFKGNFPFQFRNKRISGYFHSKGKFESL